MCNLCCVQILRLDNNEIGDAGVMALADAAAGGALPQLTNLYLDGNKIGDTGLSALASACASGALPELKEICVDNQHMRHPQLVAACQPRGIAIE